MGFKAGKKVVGEKADLLKGLPLLTRDDCLFLLNMIRKSEFKGEDVEKLFNSTLKLQKMYIDLGKFEKKK